MAIYPNCFKSLLLNYLTKNKTMEKLTFFDLMTIILPGALFTMILQITLKDTVISFDDFSSNTYYALTIFLSLSIFMGSLIINRPIYHLKTSSRISNQEQNG